MLFNEDCCGSFAIWLTARWNFPSFTRVASQLFMQWMNKKLPILLILLFLVFRLIAKDFCTTWRISCVSNRFNTGEAAESERVSVSGTLRSFLSSTWMQPVATQTHYNTCGPEIENGLTWSTKKIKALTNSSLSKKFEKLSWSSNLDVCICFFQIDGRGHVGWNRQDIDWKRIRMGGVWKWIKLFLTKEMENVEQ